MFYVPDIIQVYTNMSNVNIFNLQKQLVSKGGTERQCVLPKASQLVNSRTRVKKKINLLPDRTVKQHSWRYWNTNVTGC